MRRLVYVLLLLNLGYLGWQLYVGQQEPAGSAPLVDDVPGTLSIRTLAEHQSSLRSSSVAAFTAQQLEQGRLLGGFGEHAEAAALLQRLRSLNISGQIVERLETISVEYQILLPGGESRRMALRKSDELASKNIKSMVVQPQVDSGYALLLNAYDTEQAASLRIDELAQLGYAAKVQALERTRRNYWVQIEEQGMRLLDEQVLSVIRKDFRGLQQL